MILVERLIFILHLFNLYHNSYALTFEEEYPNVNLCFSHILASDTFRDDKAILSEIKRLEKIRCTHLQQRLRIHNVDSEENINLDFLEEINGDVKISLNKIKRISFKNLRAIRGNSNNSITWNNQRYSLSLQISGNSELEHIDFRNLKAIQQHNVFISNNKKLTYIPYSIDWKQLFQNANEQKIIDNKEGDQKVSCSSDCEPINGKKYCWGPSKDECQIEQLCRKRLIGDCHFCFHNKRNEKNGCCSDECLGGCKYYGTSNCFTCKHTKNGKKCMGSCPPKYRSALGTHVPNKDFKYKVESFCTKECPVDMFPEDDRCVYKCGHGYFLNETKVCVRCYGNKCKVSCELSKIAKEIGDQSSGRLSAKLLKRLTNCTQLIGVLFITKESFTKFGVTEQMLYTHLKNVRSIYGGLSYIFDNHLKNMSFLQGLVKIKKMMVDPSNQDKSVKQRIIIANTELEYLGWKSFKEADILVGIQGNKKLCYVDSLPAEKIFRKRKILRLAKCPGKKCDPQCSSTGGCWGPGNNLCYECKNLIASGRCVANCSDTPGFFLKQESDRNCTRCHSECLVTCNGTEPNQCLQGCRNKEENGVCVKECSHNHYADPKSNTCLPCHPVCFARPNVKVCTGPNFKPGKMGCNLCKALEIDRQKTIIKCVKDCPKNTFRTAEVASYSQYFPDGIGIVCEPCHKLCSSCQSKSQRRGECHRCTGVWFKNKCIEQCPSDFAYNSTVNNSTNEKSCLLCHRFCIKGCTGPKSTDCNQCRDRKIYLDEKINKFYCNDSCPFHKSVEEIESSTNQVICVSLWESKMKKEEQKRMKVTLGIVLAMLLLVIIVIIITVLCLRKKALAERMEAELKARYSNLTEPNSKDNEALCRPPNMGRLAIISIEDLIFEDQSRPLGFGAFGYVYKGKWRVPKTEDPLLRKSVADFYLPVAIKVIKNMGIEENEAILQEAKIMASVSHMYCLRFIGVCLSYEKPCLVTAYVKEGSLDKFLVKNKHKITSLVMLSWAEQIADGMLYLSRRNIIHRDLAARNVLVNRLECVQITDFGLAKMLENSKEKEVIIKSGKVPIRWLAIETLTEGKYSHETDIWAYGVTLWEMFTFGNVPYEDQATTDIADFVLKGGRLPQPDICSLDVYIILVNCWLENPTMRPTFENLMQTFTSYCKNPGRYLSIQGDPYEIPSPASNMEMTANFNNSYYEGYGINKTKMEPTTTETTLPLLISDNNYEHKDEPDSTIQSLLAEYPDEYDYSSMPASNDKYPLPTRSSKSLNPFRKSYDTRHSNVPNQPVSSKAGSKKGSTLGHDSLENNEEQPIRTNYHKNRNSSKENSLLSETPRFYSNHNNQPLSPQHNSQTTASADEYLEPIVNSDRLNDRNDVTSDTDGYLEPVLNNRNDQYVNPSPTPKPKTSSNANNKFNNGNSDEPRKYENIFPLKLSRDIPSIEDEERSPSNFYFPQTLVEEEYLEASPKSNLIKKTE